MACDLLLSSVILPLNSVSSAWCEFHVHSKLAWSQPRRHLSTGLLSVCFICTAAYMLRRSKISRNRCCRYKGAAPPHLHLLRRSFFGSRWCITVMQGRHREATAMHARTGVRQPGELAMAICDLHLLSSTHWQQHSCSRSLAPVAS
jgi:hypothetical protein